MSQQDTVNLLRECDAGVKMGTESISEVLGFVHSEEFKKHLNRCMDEHRTLGHELEGLLYKHGDEGKNPNPVAKGMSAVKTNLMLGINDSDSTIADLMTDGCNMGVKSLNKYLNKYKSADSEAKDICLRLIRLEEKLAEDVKSYL